VRTGNSNILIKFHGMNVKFNQQLEEYLESLLCQSPSNSICRLHVFKESPGYLCKLIVHSHVKTFSAQNKKESMPSSIKSVLKDIKKQIHNWKKNRSSSELTGITQINNLDLQSLDEEEIVTEQVYKRAA